MNRSLQFLALFFSSSIAIQSYAQDHSREAQFYQYYNYNSACDSIFFEEYSPSQSEWLQANTVALTEGNNGKTLQYRQYDTDGIVVTRLDFTYNGNGKFEEVKTYFNNGGIMELNNRVLSKYDINNRLIEEATVEGTDTTYKIVFIYDINGNVIERIFQQDLGLGLEDYSKNTYSYTSGKLSKRTDYYASSPSTKPTTWNYVALNTFSYAGNNLSEHLEQLGTEQSPTEYYRYTFLYDVNDNLVRTISQGWDLGNNGYMNDVKDSIVYNNAGKFTEKLSFTNDQVDWNPLERTACSSLVTGFFAADRIIKGSMILNPNPVTYTSTISFKLNGSQIAHISLYDDKGMFVLDIADQVFSSGENMVNINLENISNGVYIVKLVSNNTVQTSKLVLAK